MPKQTFEEKIKAGKAKFKVIREGRFRLEQKSQHLGVALRRDSKGNVCLENMVLAYGSMPPTFK